MSLAKKEIEIHSAQAKALVELLYKKEAGFAELNLLGLSTDHFAFHLRRLVKRGLIEKTAQGYRLTIAGKEYANRFESSQGEVIYQKQAKLGVLPCGVRKRRGRERCYLLQERLKQPFFGISGFMSGKIQLGESVFETAAREFREETGLEGEMEFKGVLHKREYSASQELLEDEFFYIVRIDNPRGMLKESFLGGRNFWLTEEEIKKLEKKFPTVLDVVKILNSKKFTFLGKKLLAVGF
jgi:hypothetical protein